MADQSRLARGSFLPSPIISQVADREIPTEWHVKLPAKSVDIKIKALVQMHGWMSLYHIGKDPFESLELIEDVVIWK